jgi:nucleoside-diphosphate-sugar epimerase
MPFDAVIHCATCYGRAGESDSEVRTANFDFPQRLFTAIAEVETPAFINTDTILPSAINAYARTKAEFRAWAAQAASSTQTSFINVKFDHMYGPGEDATKFISKITNLCLCNSPIDLTDGQQMRDFIHISDLTEAYMTILAACGDHLLKSEELQIGTGEPTKVRAVVEMIHKFAGSRSELRFGAIPHREHEPMFSSMNAARLRALGWNPKTSLARGISHVVDFERRKIG